MSLASPPASVTKKRRSSPGSASNARKVPKRKSSSSASAPGKSYRQTTIGDPAESRATGIHPSTPLRPPLVRKTHQVKKYADDCSDGGDDAEDFVPSVSVAPQSKQKQGRNSSSTPGASPHAMGGDDAVPVASEDEKIEANEEMVSALALSTNFLYAEANFCSLVGSDELSIDQKTAKSLRNTTQ